MRGIMAIAAALVVTAATARADFVSSYSEWRDMSTAAKTGYAKGLVDGMTIFGGSDYQLAFGEGLRNCLFELKISDVMLSEGITRYYEQNTAKWGDSPAIAFIEAFTKGPCVTHISAARVARGLSPWGKE